MCFRHLTEETKQISIYCIWLEAQNYTHLETLSITLWILATLGPSFTVSLLTLYSYYQSYIQKWNAHDLKHPNLLQLYSIYLEGFVFFFKQKNKFNMMLFSSSILFANTFVMGLDGKRADFQIAAQEP